jgi:D-alanyl-lipoteichoic acid acyltransferase DltB (MBOAT superfamily)
MQFNSVVFFVFYSIAALLYFLVPKGSRWSILLAASMYFYLTFEPVYFVVVAGVILSVYFAALGMNRVKTQRSKKVIYLLTIISILLLLVIFKYYNFLNENLADLLSVIHIKNPVPFVSWILPVGISYYIFQSIGYLVDVKNEKMAPEKHLGYYALFILFFPHVSSGPIARAGDLLPQFRKPLSFSYDNFFIGSSQVLYGLFKKAVVGDMIGDYVGTYFGGYENSSGFATLFACWLFLFQLYADFSGYSDIAVGLARILGINITNNFSLPLFSKTMTELWRRWHISLSTWLRDYLFIPFTISMRDLGKAGVVLSQMLTFAICGIWHGAGWPFLVYGLIHGFYLSAEFLLKIKSSFYNKNFLRKCLGVFITFNLLSLSLVFFRNNDWAKIGYIFRNIFTNFLPLKPKFHDQGQGVTMLVILAVLLSLEYFILRNHSWGALLKNKPRLLMFLNVALFILLLLFGISSSTQFIYFQF